MVDIISSPEPRGLERLRHGTGSQISVHLWTLLSHSPSTYVHKFTSAPLSSLPISPFYLPSLAVPSTPSVFPRSRPPSVHASMSLSSSLITPPFFRLLSVQSQLSPPPSLISLSPLFLSLSLSLSSVSIPLSSSSPLSSSFPLSPSLYLSTSPRLPLPLPLSPSLPLPLPLSLSLFSPSYTTPSLHSASLPRFFFTSMLFPLLLFHFIHLSMELSVQHPLLSCLFLPFFLFSFLLPFGAPHAYPLQVFHFLSN